MMIYPYSFEEVELLAQAFSLGVPVSISRSPEGWAELQAQIDQARQESQTDEGSQESQDTGRAP